MESAIVYVVINDDRHDARQQGGILLATTSKFEGNEAVLQLGEFVWQIDFRSSPDALARLVLVCEQQGLSYGILPLADAPRWIRRDPDSR